MIDFVIKGLERFGDVALLVEDHATRRAPELLMEFVHADAVLRIEHETEAPDGTAWERWSDRYARTRSGDDKLLRDSGDLQRSLELRRQGNVIELISGLPYAGTHQRTRPYAGVSADVERDFDVLLVEEFERRAARV